MARSSGGRVTSVMLTLALTMTLVAVPTACAVGEGGLPLWWPEERDTRARFADTTTNVTVTVGNAALLPCTVFNLRDRSVTWMRQRDLHILTVGDLTYSADERFQVIHPDGSDEWTLEVRTATFRDAGVYECHVNSDPKVSRHVTLRIKAPVVVVEGARTRHIQAGSVLELRCVVRHPGKPAPNHVVWFQATEVLDYDSPRGGVSIQTEKYNSRTVSQVMLSNVREGDSGEYTCSPSDLPPAVVTVHVQHDQHQAAVQQGGVSIGGPGRPPPTQTILLLLLLPSLVGACWSVL